MNFASPPGERNLLVATVSDARILTRVLKQVAFTNLCYVLVSAGGLVVRTQMERNMQATAYIPAAVFDHFQFESPDDDDDNEEEDDSFTSIDFEVSLSNFIECLNIYGNGGPAFASRDGSNRSKGVAEENGDRDPFEEENNGETSRRSRTKFGSKEPASSGSTSVRMSYAGFGHPLVLELMEDKVSTTCELDTFDTRQESVDPLAFNDEQKVAQVILPSKEFVEAIQSIDSTSRSVTLGFLTAAIPTRMKQVQRTKGVTLEQDGGESEDIGQETTTGPLADVRSQRKKQRRVPMMMIKAEGDAGSSEMEFPHDESGRLFTSFFCRKDVSNDYQFKYFKEAVRAFNMSFRTSIRVAPNGLLSVQFVFAAKAIRGGGTSSIEEHYQPKMTHDPIVEILFVPEYVGEEDGQESNDEE